MTAGILISVVMSGCGAIGPDTVGSEVDQEASPLARYLGFGHHRLDEELQFNADELKREQFVEACMNAEGFEYMAVPAGAVVVQNEAGGVTEIGDGAEIAQVQRANEAFVASLSTKERERYWLTLAARTSYDEGISAEEMARLDPNGDGDISYKESLTHGCRGAASERVPGVFYVARVLGRDYDQLRSAVESIRSKTAVVLGTCVSPFTTTAGVDDRQLFEFIVKLIDSGHSDSDELKKCLVDFDRVERSEVQRVESAFYDAHKDVIDEFAVPAPGT